MSVRVLALLLLPTLPAQVAPGDGIRLTIVSSTCLALPENPRAMSLVSPVTGAVTAVLGLVPAERHPGSGLLDPATGEIVVGGPCGGLRALRLAGHEVTQRRQIRTPAAPVSIAAVALDRDGNYFYCTGTELLRVDRQTGLVSVWDELTANGVYNALTIDAEAGRMYVGTFSLLVGNPGFIFGYDIDAGPAPGDLLLDTGAAGLDGFITGLTHDGAGTIYIAATGFSGPTVAAFEPATGAAALVPGAPATPVNGLAYDRERDVLHLVGRGGYGLLDLGSGALTEVASPVSSGAIGEPVSSGVIVNDLLDVTTAFPRQPSASTPFVFEVAAHAQPGELAAVIVVAVDGIAIDPVALVVGQAGRGGDVRASWSIDPSALGVRAGSSMTLRGARASGRVGVVLGSSIDVVFVP
ncbi:MAG: hypothetical protein AAF628_18345 [Planctomycetota bacterium]